MTRTFFAILVIAAVLVAAPIQNVLSFQGKLVEGGVPVDGTRNITFKIYNVAAGGVFLWQESHVAVPVVGGLFNVELGSVTAFPSAVNFSEQYWVGVSVGGGAEISPRYKLTSAAYSMSPWTINGNNIYRDAGFVGIGTDSPIKPLHVEGTLSGGAGSGNAIGYFKNNAPDTDAAGIYAECANTPFWGYGGYFKGGYIGVRGEASMEGAGFRYGVRGDASGGNDNYGVYGFSSGTATTNYGVYGSATGATTNWAGYFSSGNVYISNGLGIGTTSPTTRLDVNGQVRIRGGSPGAGKILTSDADGLATWETPSGGSNWTLSGGNVYRTTGRVGIGTSSPGAGLHIIGTGYPSGFLFVESTAGNDAGIRLYEGSDVKWHIFNSVSNDGLEFRREGFATTMFLDQALGNVGIGTTSPSENLHIKQSYSGGGFRMEHNSSTNRWDIGTASTENLWFSYNGSLKAYVVAATGAWTVSSDRRLKNSIEPLGNVLDALIKIEPVTYFWNDDIEKTQRSIGVIAQDVAEQFPLAVPFEEEFGYYGVDYNSITVLTLGGLRELTEIVKEQQTQIEQLKARIDELENK